MCVVWQSLDCLHVSSGGAPPAFPRFLSHVVVLSLLTTTSLTIVEPLTIVECSIPTRSQNYLIQSLWGQISPLKEQQHAVQHCVARIVSSNLVITENRFLCHFKIQYTGLQ